MRSRQSSPHWEYKRKIKYRWSYHKNNSLKCQNSRGESFVLGEYYRDRHQMLRHIRHDHFLSKSTMRHRQHAAMHR